MELMVAMGITALIVTVLVSVTSVALDAWRRGRAEVRAARQAKAALDTMARDFESMLVRSGNSYQWLVAQVDPNIKDQNAQSGDKQKIPNAAQIIFFNSATDRYDGKVGDATKDLGGDVTATGYRLVYRDQIQNADAGGAANTYPVFALYRHLVDPKPAFDSLLAQTDLLGAWTQTFLAKDFDQANFLVENIYEITVTFTVEYQEKNDPNSATSPVVTKTRRVSISPDTAAGGDDSRVTSLVITGQGLKITPDNPVLASGHVVAVDFAITVLSDFGIQMAKRANVKAEQLVREHGYHYTKSVTVPQS